MKSSKMTRNSSAEQLKQNSSRETPGAAFSRRAFFGRSARAIGAAVAVTVLSGSGLLAGCESTHTKPDQKLSDLYAQANAVAGSLDASDHHDVAVFVHAHADALRQEIRRICGTDKDGNSPSTCSDSTLDSESNGGNPQPAGGNSDEELSQKLKDLRSSVVSVASQADTKRNNGLLVSIASSLSVIAAQTSLGDSDSANTGTAQDNNAASQSSSTATSGSSSGNRRPNKADVTAMTTLLTTEYQIIYGFGLALPFADSALKKSIESAANKHRATRDRIISWLEDQAKVAQKNIPLADAAYSFAAPPTDSDTAHQFLINLELFACSRTYDQARALNTGSAMDIASSLITHSAVDAAYFIDKAGGNAMNDDRLHLPGMGTSASI
ncbi:DUF4439 domain-containing protein [Corynebacterium sp.]|uniref:DUF4439 domain-containing protein n=1 Tax=Corynebacterium sp. TaxID=1720 RepID=UPI0026DC6073|nr:DUF4439 domain-containing protein [Corynebacterium sp.]MDO4914092.1 DUF4439 domain-containing protein [Corynebacterium sp.]